MVLDLSLLVVFFGLQADIPAKEAIETAIAVIENQEQSIDCWEIRYQLTSDSFRSPQAFDQQKHDLLERRKGAVYRVLFRFEPQSIKRGGEKVVHVMEHAFDGSQYRYLTHTKRGALNDATISTETGNDYQYTNRAMGIIRPLSEFLRVAADSGKASWQTVNSRKLLRCSGVNPDSPSVTFTFDLDPNFGWQPRHMLSEIKPDDLMAKANPGLVLRTIERTVVSFIQIDQIFLFEKIKKETFDIKKDGSKNLKNRTALVVEEARINTGIPDSEFTIPFPPGTKVLDSDRKVIFVEGEPGNETQINTQAPIPIPLTAQGGQWIWWSDWRICVSVAGISGMALLLLRWWSRRSSLA